ncbi:inositol monophosphatase [Serinibacter arcticus]|uniref:inositol-phosphate phosphatase n=2 Tax=Serinibacter arcticus TaxID=1655435 RepID=A0A2U1ZZB7_9MICO|nr:inositol monophosphatase [Serinibacter arcticus]
MRRAAVDVAATKSSATDVVTQADLASEALLLELITAYRPQDGILGEEGTQRDGDSGLTWVLDPIDGTVNYLYGRADYAVSVAVVAGDPSDVTTWQPVAGCVHQPATGRTWTAGLGQGSSVDGRALSAPASTALGSALVGTGFSYSAPTRAWQGEVVARLLPQVRDVRRAGAGALDAAAVATGELDAHYELGLNPWDIAAAVLVVTEAGGRVRYLDVDGVGLVSVITQAGLEAPLTDAIESAIASSPPRS